MTSLELATRFMAMHKCNAFCRDSRHAGVIWCNPELVAPDEERRELRELVEYHDLVFVGAEPSPESRRPADLMNGYDHTTGWYGAGRVGEDCTPWLVTWEVPHA